jgi:hypothetical protein
VGFILLSLFARFCIQRPQRMINLHFNGDIVRCPDTSEAKKKVRERYEHEYKCPFGVLEYDCQVRNNYHLKHRIVNERCDCHLRSCRDYKENYEMGFLWREYVCPKMRDQYIHGLKKKTFEISSQVYRKMASAAHDLVKSSRHKTLFLTLTFPPFKKEPNEKQINQCFSRFVENLRENYDCSGYVAVREYGEDNNRIHFHIILSIPYHSFVTLNAAWCHAIQEYSVFSRCALRTTPKSLYIKTPVAAIRYFCKYFSKSRYTQSATRLVFISNNLIKTPVRVYNTGVETLLKGYKGIYIQQTSDYSTCYRITDDKSFMTYCNTFLYDTFEKAYNYPLFSKKYQGLTVPAPNY